MSTWTVACPDDWAPEIERELAAAVPERLRVTFATDADAATKAKLAADADFLLVGTYPVTAELLGNTPKLRMVHKWGIGVDSIDLDAARRAGVGVAITAGANAHAVAEHAVLMILATLRQLPYVDRELHAGNWVYPQMRVRARQLLGRKVGILGLGNIGRAVARRLQGFEADLLYYDPVRPDERTESSLGVGYRELDQLLAECDVLTVHCPGGVENHHFIGQRALGLMKDEAILVNTARGEIVDTEALRATLDSGKLLGAGLDVFETEPLEPDHPLLRARNVVVSPHTAASVLDNVGRVAAHAFGNILRVLDGQPVRAEDLVVEPGRR